MAKPHVPELALPAGPDRDRLLALRQLRDCGVVRARWDHPGLSALYRSNDAEARPVPPDMRVVDYRLTARGRHAAQLSLHFQPWRF